MADNDTDEDRSPKEIDQSPQVDRRRRSTESPAPPPRPPSETQSQLAAKVCLGILALLSFYLVTFVLAAFRQPQIKAEARSWEGSSPVVWDLTAWFAESAPGWAGSLGILFAIATGVVGVFTKLYRDDKRLSKLVWLLCVCILLTGFCYYASLRWPEVRGALTFYVGDSSCPAGKALFDSPGIDEQRVGCAGALLGGFWQGMLVWFGTGLATALGLQIQGVRKAIGKIQGKVGL